MVKLKRSIQNLIKCAVSPFVSLLYRRRLREGLSDRPCVLFMANNELMLQYLEQLWDAYHNKDKYEVHLCSTETVVFRFSKCRTLRRIKVVARSRGIKFWPDFVANKIEWDLLITAEPDIPCYLLREKTQKILIQHALIGIKTIDGWLYPYHPERCFLKNGSCKFDAILENTTQALNKVVSLDPRYKDVVKLAGSIPADNLLELNKHRTRIRNEFGYTENDYVVLIQSTFRESLIEDLGTALLDECQRISQEKNWNFIVSLHPNHWHGDYAQKQPWGQKALEYESELIKVRRPDEDANLSLVACDIAITDHTSLAYNYMLLNKPALFDLPPQGNQVMDVMGELVECCLILERVEQLEKRLQEAPLVFDRDRASKIIAELFPYLGKAKERNNEILDEILK